MFHYNSVRPHTTLTKRVHGKLPTPTMAAGLGGQAVDAGARGEADRGPRKHRRRHGQGAQRPPHVKATHDPDGDRPLAAPSRGVAPQCMEVKDRWQLGRASRHRERLCPARRPPARSSAPPVPKRRAWARPRRSLAEPARRPHRRAANCRWMSCWRWGWVETARRWCT